MIPLPPSLAGQRIIPVVVIDDAGFAPDVAVALMAGGIGCVEITLRTAAGFDAISAASQSKSTIVGAGTVLTPDHVARAAEAGARFIVTPGFDPEVVARAIELGLDVLPGTATASEVQAALRMGVDVVKLFPADRLGGLDLITSLAGPFPTTGFVPSGGVSASNLAAYLAHPNVPAVSGSWMVSRHLLGARDVAEIERLSREAVALAASVTP
ncbi:MAG: bifunctional 4-hydroxy-2-oxoglutarate aldolase/2-dehydro-3-deoxy-phosphogluconate aldolase [Pseudolysinimonas sp.]